MNLNKFRNLLVISIIVLFGIQLPWYFVVQYIVNKTQTKTIATVIRIEIKDAGCSGDLRSKYSVTCDHSKRRYPVYEYFDSTGKKYEQDDRFFGQYKQNNPLKKLLLKKVGDKVPAYYTKNKPQEVLFMASPFAYTAWLIPLYVSFAALVLTGIITFIIKYKQ